MGGRRARGVRLRPADVKAAAALAIAILSCAAKVPKTPPPTAAAADSSDGDSPDPCDICVMRAYDDATAVLDDGCPGFRMTDGCAMAPGEQARVTRAAADIAANAHLTSVRLVSAKADCAGAVRDALVRAGVPAKQLVTATKGTDDSVFLDVAAWEGRQCAQ